jgi:methionine-S-sulfoxide reductase
VIRTRVGYAGGVTLNPTYHNLGDHSEAVQIDYDPQRISYGDLLDIFWKSHDPARRSWSRQYMAAVFFHDEKQRRLALDSRDREASRRGSRIYTEILPLTDFTLAEDYHQKYRLRSESVLLREFTLMYPDEQGFINSTAAARINGYLGGYGTPKELSHDLESFGLSQKVKETLVDILSESRPAFRSCPVNVPGSETTKAGST